MQGRSKQFKAEGKLEPKGIFVYLRVYPRVQYT